MYTIYYIILYYIILYYLILYYIILYYINISIYLSISVNTHPVIFPVCLRMGYCMSPILW